ncbi:hypothetical protein [Spirillospora sp. CA-294931]|uniref:hypothetical protein n=1 Tax=Spirillospora sp. CA-294931 TaxID=3240042 RepID=UPI003D8AB5D0
MSIADGIDAVLLQPQVSRGQLCLVEPLDAFPEYPLAEANRAGLIECVPGFAFLVTGHHEGTVGMTVAVADHDLGADLSYDDVVEVSYYSPTGDISIEENSGEAYELPELSVGPHRLRYHLRMAADGKTAESVLLQIWPDEPGESATLKVTSPLARTWLDLSPIASHASACAPPVQRTAPQEDEAPWQGDTTLELTPRVNYHQMYLCDTSLEEVPCPLQDPNVAGLVESVADFAQLSTGLAAGPVNLRVTVAQRDPGARMDEYEDVFEVSLFSSTGLLTIDEWEPTRFHALPPLAAGRGTYRLRYHVRDYDELYDCASPVPVGHYLLQIWPAPVTDSMILKVPTGGRARAVAPPLRSSSSATDLPLVPLPFNGLAERWSRV